jgi:tRNA U38,U39,U40 pseudouridine synthase TruA
MFKHINIYHPAGLSNMPTRKIGLLVGCVPPRFPKESEDKMSAANGRPVFHDSGAQDYLNDALWQGLFAMNNYKQIVVSNQYDRVIAAKEAEEENQESITDSGGDKLRPHAWSRCTSVDSRSSVFLSQAPTIPSVSELVVFTAPMIPENTEKDWVDKLNEKLPDYVQVHGRCNVPPSTHAERFCELRRYEVMVPLNVIAPHLESTIHTLNEQQTANVITQFAQREAHSTTTLPPFSLIEEEPTSQNGWSGPWKDFSKKLKVLMRKFQRRANWHNYAHGVLPHDQIATSPKVIRFKHMTLVRTCSLVSNEGVTATAAASAENNNNNKKVQVDDCFVVLSIHGNMFLRDMCESMVGLLIAVVRGWLPEEAIDQSMRPDVILTDLPKLPTSMTMFVEGRYDNFVNKFRVKLNPGYSANEMEYIANDELNTLASKKRKADWKCEKCGESNFAKRTVCHKCDSPTNNALEVVAEKDQDKEEGEEEKVHVKWIGFLNDYSALVESKKEQFRQYTMSQMILREREDKTIEVWSSLIETRAEELRRSFETAFENIAPIAASVAQLKKNGKTPRVKRGKAGKAGAESGGSGDDDANNKGEAAEEAENDDFDDSNDISAVATSQQDTENEAALSLLKATKPSNDVKYEVYAKTLHLLRLADASGLWPSSSPTRAKIILGNGGTFALGAMPPPLEFPNANKIFRELLVAAFQLEASLKPNRKPSSTIAVNRNAQFTPHVDTGNGAGQSNSLIVALGDFVGGEIVIEGEVNDIRYNPIEFNGWTQRHWTKPFHGERFSLVWFTPLGCENMAGINM